MNLQWTNGVYGLTECRDGTFLCNINDVIIGRLLMGWGEFCAEELDIVCAYIAPGSTVLDIGANIGVHSVRFAKTVGTKGKVYSFEPQRHIFRLLQANLAVNLSNNVAARQVLLGQNESIQVIPVIDPRTEYNFGAFSPGAQGLPDTTESESVEMLTVDGLDLPACDFIKIDVEGMELDVLSGAQKTIATFHPVLFVENHDKRYSKEILTQLMALDYKLYWVISPVISENNFRGAPTEAVLAKLSPSVNVLALPEGVKLQHPDLKAVTDPSETWQQLDT